MADGIKLVERGPLRAAAFSWQTSERRMVLTVICKVTYQFVPGHSLVAREQVEVHRGDIPWGGDSRHSLQAASEYVPFKRGVDVVLTGHAYAPHGRPVRSLVVQVAVGGFRKCITVCGDRQVSPRGEVSEPAEFMKMPLCWERAAGGPGTSNPVGIPSFGNWMPNFQPSPSMTPNSAISRGSVIGVGPIAPKWPERVLRLGAHASTWDQAQWTARPLPKDIDAGYFNCAPLDQQMDHVDLTETIELENLLAEFPHMRTQLPAGAPQAILHRHSSRDRLNLRCDTIWVDTDRGICCVTWRGSQQIESTVGIEILAAMASSSATNSKGQAPTIEQVSSFSHDHLKSEENDLAATTLIGLRPPRREPVLPFAPGTAERLLANTESATTPTPRNEDDPSATQMISFVAHVRDLPFLPNHRAAEPMHVARVSESSIVTDPAPQVPVEPFKFEVGYEPEESLPQAPEPVKPPMIGPIAKVQQDELATSTPSAQESTLAVIFDPSSMTIETWAEMTAELDKAVQTRSDVLHARELTDAEFTAVDKHWKSALEKEASDLGFALRFKFDAAYVGKLERLRDKEITTAEYARIAGAGGHARVADVLREIEMPTEAHLPIVRQWTTKFARNPKLSAELIQAIMGAREGVDKVSVEMSH